jgi:Ca2+-binding RTX toxin-like protein
LLNGGGGTNTLNYSGTGVALVTVNLQDLTATGTGGFRNIQALVGSAGAGTLIGTNNPTTWQITGANAGTAGAFAFSSIGNLTGGTGSDTFKFSPSGSVVSLDGGGAPAGQGDWLDYSSFPAKDPVTVNLATGSATRVNSGTAGAVSNIQNVVGGAGNDSLTGNTQGNILLGGGGNDTLVGGSGRSLLIGDGGSDTITGGGDDDILIAGTTAFDADDTALMAILQEWQRSDKTYSQRIADLKSGVGLKGSFRLLRGTTVLGDGAADMLTGGAGLDWFLANLKSGVRDTITDLNNGGTEQVN